MDDDVAALDAPEAPDDDREPWLVGYQDTAFDRSTQIAITTV